MNFTIRNTAILTALAIVLGMTPALAAGDVEHPHEPAQGWSFDGFFGRYDTQSLQRGYLVYEQVCAACHSLKYVSYRNLGEPGALGFTEDEVRAIAAGHQVPAGPDETGAIVDDIGMLLTRPGTPADRIVQPFANDQAAMASNGGVLPPDLSLMAKARANGPSYIMSLLEGYADPHGDDHHEDGLAPGTHHNAFFPGHQIAMAPPLSEGQVEYPDGTEASVEQMAYDVSNFLMWAAEPKLEKRKRLGFQVLIFLLLLTGLCYASYKYVWRDVEH